MFNVRLDYPAYENEVEIVKSTTTDREVNIETVLTAEEIQMFQHLVRKVPVADNVVEFAVNLVHRTRPNTSKGSQLAHDYLEWGAGPRASQFLVIGAKCNALLNGKYSPDIEDVIAVSKPALRHRIVRNFKAEAEGRSIDSLIEDMVAEIK
jgi:MoxR-like ATPase